MNPARLTALVLTAHAARAGERASTSYAVATDSADGGGQRTTSALYSMDASFSGLSGISEIAVPLQTIYHGYTGQLTEPASVSFVVTTPADSGPGSLRQAICNAEAHPGADTITFAPGLSGGVIRLTSASLEISDLTGPVAITAADLPQGLGLSGEGARRVFRILAGSTVLLDSLTISNGLGTPGFLPGNGGGGIYNGGTLTVNRCTITRNSVPAGGGTISVGGGIASFQGVLTVSNSTIAFNSVQAGTSAFGGGVIGTFNTTLFHHCTIASNTATGGGATRGGGVALDNGTLRLSHTLVAGNTGGSNPDLGDLGPAGVTSLGFNLLGNGAGSGLVHGVNGDQVGAAATPINARLGPLQDNGGPSPTMLPTAGSPALDAGNPTITGLGLTDQRGFPRVTGGRIDIGAVENCLRLYYTFDNSTAVDNAGSSFTTYTSGNGSKTPLSRFNLPINKNTTSLSAIDNDGLMRLLASSFGLNFCKSTPEIEPLSSTPELCKLTTSSSSKN